MVLVGGKTYFDQHTPPLYGGDREFSFESQEKFADRYGDTEHFDGEISRLLAAQILFSLLKNIKAPLKRKPVFLPSWKENRSKELTS